MSTTLDDMFALVESMGVPEGYRAEIIEGQIRLNPQRDIHAIIIRRFTQSLEDAFGADALILWDVRIDFPGLLNGYAPDVALLRDGAHELGSRHTSDSVRLVGEVVSRSSRRDDYGVKLETYARAGVPAYVIADPYTGWIHVHQRPDGDTYTDILTYAFGTPFEVGDLGATIHTKRWPTEDR